VCVCVYWRLCGCVDDIVRVCVCVYVGVGVTLCGCVGRKGLEDRLV